jgi:hypothetical protein
VAGNPFGAGTIGDKPGMLLVRIRCSVCNHELTEEVPDSEPEP